MQKLTGKDLRKFESKFNSVTLIDNEGNNHGKSDIEQAKDMASDSNLDLILIDPKQNPPVCRLGDYGKFQYKQNKKQENNKKKVQTKEIQFKPNTNHHDILTKTNKINKILKEGNKVEITIKFSGREMAHQEVGDELWGQILDNIQEGHCSREPKKVGNRFFATLSPGKPKNDQDNNKEKQMGPSQIKQSAKKKGAQKGNTRRRSYR